MLKYIYDKTLGALLRMLYNRLIKPIFTIEDSPHSIALGFALGLWIALTPTVGIQMTLAVIFCTIFRANVVIAVALCWISNPVTFLPMYYGYYKLGLVITQKEGIAAREFTQLIEDNYVIVNVSSGGEDVSKLPKDVFREIALNKKASLIYPGEDQILAEIIVKFSKELELDLDSGWCRSIDGSFEDVAKEINTPLEYGIVDRITYIKFRQKTPPSNPRGPPSISAKPVQLNVVAEIPRQYGLLGSVHHIVLLSLQEFALPMWLGSLIIATALAIPSYPIIKWLIIRFRSSLSKLKDSPKIVRLRETTKLRLKRRKRDETSIQ